MKSSRLIKAIVSLILVCMVLIPLPAYADGGDFSVEAESAILVDLDTGRVFYEDNADARCYPASVTKMMTCLLINEAIEEGTLSEDQMVTVSKSAVEAIQDPEAATVFLAPGEEIRLGDLMYCLMLPSANDAANVLAETMSGSVTDFVERMNARAAELGCTGTHFVTPNGLHDDDHYTTARDLVLIAQEGMKHSYFRQLVSTPSYQVPATNYSQPRDLYSTNYMIHPESEYYYSFAIGVKTGYTTQAGHCLVAAGQKTFYEGEDGKETVRRYLAVILGADHNGVTGNTAFTKAQMMLEHAFNDYEVQTLVEKNHVITELPVDLTEDGDTVHIKAADSVTGLAPRDLDPAGIQLHIDIPDQLTAPVAKDQAVGTLTVSYNGEEYGQVRLVAAEERTFSRKLYYIRAARAFWDKWYGKAAVAGVGLLILIVIILALIERSRYS